MLKPIIRRILLLFTVLAAATAIGLFFRHIGFPETNIVIVYLLAVLIISWLAEGLVYGVLSSLIATFSFNYFFTAPYYSFFVQDSTYLITFAVMLITAIITGWLTSFAKRSAQTAIEKEAQTKAVFQLTTRLTDAGDTSEIKEIAVSAISYSLNCEAGFIEANNEEMPDIRYLTQRNKSSDSLKSSLPGSRASNIRLQQDIYAGNAYWPVIGKENVLGIIHIPNQTARNFSESQVILLQSMVESIALAMDRQQTAEKNRKTRDAAIQERYRANLLRAISHDLRTPLAGIIGTSEMLMKMIDSSDPRYPLAEGIHKEAEWLHSLVENILSLTRLQDGIALHKESEAVEEVVGEAVSRVQKRCPEPEISIDIPDELLLVPMDAKLIEQVLMNLLDNALKHTPKEGEIGISATVEGKDAIFSVKDSGSGIDEEDLPHIFETFYTTNTQHSNAKQGIGLGLAICDTIIKAHGGTLSAQNRQEKSGAVFTFTLPLEDG